MQSEKINKEQSSSGRMGEGQQTQSFEDNRPEAESHRNMQAGINESPRMMQLKVERGGQTAKQLQVDNEGQQQETVARGGFVGSDGDLVELELAGGVIVIRSTNAPPDLAELIRITNEAGSETALNQIMEVTQRQTRVHVRLVNEEIDNGLLGLHQAHDADGNVLDWDSMAQDFDGVPAYAAPGVYSEATITIFRGNIRDSGGNASSHRAAGERLSTAELVAGTFQHEVHHDTDSEFIEDLRRRRDGEPHTGVTSHQNIHPQDDQVYGEIGDSVRELSGPERRRRRRGIRRERRAVRRENRAEGN